MDKLTLKKNWEQIQPHLVPYWFLLPALVMLGLTVFYPAVQAFLLSFTKFEYDLTQPPVWVGFKNFQRLWRDPIFWQTFRNTVLYLVCVVPVLVSLPLALAILVNRQLRGIHWFRVAYYTPVVISMVVAGIAWKWLYADNGLLNQLLQIFKLPSVPWLTSPDLALFSVMVVTIWKGLGYYMVIYLAGLQGIPQELYEAAAIDGSDGLKKHWDITVPLMRPYLFLVAVISAISATKVFEEVYVMTRGGPNHSSETLVFYLYNKAFGELEMSYACTIGLVMFLIILCLSMIRLGLERRSPNPTAGNLS
jgi:putative chitobiose transport system permease protein